MQLSEHFSLAEFSRSETASKYKIDNTPPADIVTNLKKTAAKLEEVRTLLGGKPIRINSGYRSPALNAAVNGSVTSDHNKGLAADFVCPTFGTPYEICRLIAKSGIKFDQLIFEQTWVHIGIGPRMRQEVLTYKNGYAPGINK